MPRFVELSHKIVPGMKTYPGLPEPQVDVVVDYESSRQRYQGQAEFYIASLHLCGNTGTYVDAPRHRFHGATDLADLALDRLADLAIVIVDATRAGRAIGEAAFQDLQLDGRAVLVRTDFSQRWGTPAYFTDNPFLTAGACDVLVSHGAAFVGIDSLNIDDTGDTARPAHTRLLRAGIPIGEHLTNLKAVPAEGARLHAVPIAWVGGASFPVRAYAILS